MELDNLKTVWQDYDSTLEKSLNLNLHTLDLIQTQKVKSVLTPLYWQRIIEITFHTIAIALLSIFCYYNYNQLPYAISAYMLITFYSLSFRNCFIQLKTLFPKCLRTSVVTCRCRLFRPSNIVSTIPHNSNCGFKEDLINLTVFTN